MVTIDAVIFYATFITLDNKVNQQQFVYDAERIKI